MNKTVRVIAGTAICAIGVGIFLYPNIREMQTQSEVTAIIEDFGELYPKKDVASGNESDNDSNTDEMPYAGLYEEMQAYNRTLYEGGQEIRDAFNYEESPVGFTNLEEDSYLIGYIEIPSIECELPLFIGANTENLARGAAVMGNTSMPIGGENTNCVIAAHRGYQGSAYFRNINQISAGDLIYITNPWGTLVYEAVSAEVVSPYETGPLMIEEGQDMVTLVSCHPYMLGGGPERYIVHCLRTDVELPDNGEPLAVSDPSAATETETGMAPEEGLSAAEDLIRYILPPVFIVAALVLILKKNK